LVRGGQMMFAAIVQSTYGTYSEKCHGYDGGYESHKYEKLIKFKSEQEMLVWAKVNGNEKFEIIKYEPVELVTSITVKVK